MSYDHYEQAEKLISLLKTYKHNNFANLLENAIEEGATGNEIFMALKFNLDIIIAEPTIENIIKDDCIKLRNKIHNTLESS